MVDVLHRGGPYRWFVVLGYPRVAREWCSERGILPGSLVLIARAADVVRLRGLAVRGDVAIVYVDGAPTSDTLRHVLAMLVSRGAEQLDPLWWPPDRPDPRDPAEVERVRELRARIAALMATPPGTDEADPSWAVHRVERAVQAAALARVPLEVIDHAVRDAVGAAYGWRPPRVRGEGETPRTGMPGRLPPSVSAHAGTVAAEVVDGPDAPGEVQRVL